MKSGREGAGARRWTERWEIPKQAGLSPRFRNKGLRPVTLGDERVRAWRDTIRGSAEKGPSLLEAAGCPGLDKRKVGAPKPLEWRTSLNGESPCLSLPCSLVTPSSLEREACAFVARLLAPKRFNIIFGLGACTWISDLGIHGTIH